MAIRDILRGEIPEEELDSIAAETATRHGEEFDSVRALDADNWLSTPVVVNEQFFVKIISGQNTLVHGLLTTGRNLGVFASGSEGFFKRCGTPVGMAEHELDAARQMRELGINVPEPLEAFEHDGYGIVVLEYLPDYVTIDTLPPEEVAAFATDLFSSLARMHDAKLVHGDLRGENVLIADGKLYFIDATKVSAAGIDDARAYDIACALAALEPLIGPGRTVEIAAEWYDPEILAGAERFLDFVNIRPDHDFDAVGIKGEIDKRASA